MTGDNSYVPLKESSFWKDMEAAAERCPRAFRTRMEWLHFMYFVNGTGYEWSGGRPVDLYTQIKAIDRPFEAPASVKTADPAEHPLVTLIPTIPPGQFLKRLSTDAKYKENERELEGEVYPFSKGYASFAEMPETVDVHFLVAAMIMLKHIHEYPDSLGTKGDRQEQLEMVRQSLNTGFVIIEQRGLEEAFAKSCAEFEKSLPYLSIFSQVYVQEQDMLYRQSCEIEKTLAAMTPEQKKQMAERLKELWGDEIKKQLSPPKPD